MDRPTGQLKTLEGVGNFQKLIDKMRRNSVKKYLWAWLHGKSCFLETKGTLEKETSREKGCGSLPSKLPEILKGIDSVATNNGHGRKKEGERERELHESSLLYKDKVIFFK